MIDEEAAQQSFDDIKDVLDDVICGDDVTIAEAIEFIEEVHLHLTYLLTGLRDDRRRQDQHQGVTDA